MNEGIHANSMVFPALRFLSPRRTSIFGAMFSDHAHDALFAAAASLPLEARARFLTDSATVLARRAPGELTALLIGKLRRAHMALALANACPAGDHYGDSERNAVTWSS